MKVVTIVKNDVITGVEYGAVELPAQMRKSSRVARSYKNVLKIKRAQVSMIRAEKMKKK